MAKKNSINNATPELTIDPGASGDSFVQFDINATGEFRIGVDDDDSDKFKVSQGSALGANDTLVITAAGEISRPLTPAFLATVTSDKLNQTGDGTTYSMSWDSEIFDQGGDFASNTFTAPVTGRYLLEFTATIRDLTSSHTNGFIRIQTSNRDYQLTQWSWAAVRNSSNQAAASIAVLADMDASDTAFADVQISNGTKVAGIESSGATNPKNWFSGNLQC